MPKFKFFPEDWTPDKKIMDWCHSNGLSDAQIEDQLERIKDHEFSPMRSCPVRTFRRWIRNAIQWGHVVPSLQREYRQPQELSAEQRARDIWLHKQDMKKLGVE